MTLLNDDLGELVGQEHEPNEEVQQALRELNDLPIREAIDEADN